MVLDHSSARASGSKVETLPNPNDDLSIYDIILKYQIQFTKYFGPKYAYGVISIKDEDANSIKVIARVRPLHKSTKGSTTSYVVELSKFDIWRNNIKLYDFISAK